MTWGSIAWSIDLHSGFVGRRPRARDGRSALRGRTLRADLKFQKVYVIQDIITYYLAGKEPPDFGRFHHDSPGPQGKADPRQHYPRKPPPRPTTVDSEMGRKCRK
jgi:hypothetical protein